MPLTPGEPAPWFTAPTASNPEFAFDSAAGRWVLMLFLPADAAERGPVLRLLAQRQRLFDDVRATCVVVVRDPETAATARDVKGLRWVLDQDLAVSRRFRADAPHWLLLDPALRVTGAAPLAMAETVLDRVQGLPPPAAHAGVPLHAPVLIAPRIFEPELCRALIDLHASDGGDFTGVMRDQGPRTVAVLDDLKKRRDVLLDDPELRDAIVTRFERRLFPLIRLALGFQVTEIERHVVSCYAAAEGGVFRPHRDNTTQGTAHRRFACSINLNADFEGGDLRFPEYGPATYRPPAGGAVVFSCGLLHEALPVTQGRRYAFLPFFYDAAGAQVLSAYQARAGAVTA